MFRPHPRSPRAHFGLDFLDPRPRWADNEPPFDWPFPFGRFGRRWGGPGERFFGRGDLKIVILELLKDRPRHGYDVIRALEERMGGHYRPSPGSVYPTLQMLEDLGYVTSSQQDGKKVYSITDEGRRYLKDQQSTIDDIRSRITAGWDTAQRPEFADFMHEVQRLASTLLQYGTRGTLNDAERLRRLREIVARARAEVEALGEERQSRPPNGPPPNEPRMV